MKENKLDKLLKELLEKKITKKYHSDSSTYQVNIIDDQARIVVEQIIRQHILDDHDEKTGILEAKVFSYESIISKSNFAPMLEKSIDTSKLLELLRKQEKLLYLEKFCSDEDILNALKITEEVIELITPK